MAHVSRGACKVKAFRVIGHASSAGLGCHWQVLGCNRVHDARFSPSRGGEVPSDLIERLNDAQREAVLHEGGPLLIVAGAGTGKTLTLLSRVARLIEAGVAPERIRLLTFTRRAARDMLA